MVLFGKSIDRKSLKRGDHIYVWRTAYAYAHHGIYVGDGDGDGDDKVINFTNEKPTVLDRIFPIEICFSRSNFSGLCCTDPNQEGHGRVISSSLNNFLDNGDLCRFEYAVNSAFFLLQRPGTCSRAVADPDETVVHRANYLLNNGFGCFSVLKNNCEDFAIYCKTGQRVPNQRIGRSGQAMSILGSLPLAAAAVLATANPFAMTAAVGVFCASRFAADIGKRKVQVEDLATDPPSPGGNPPSPGDNPSSSGDNPPSPPSPGDNPPSPSSSGNNPPSPSSSSDNPPTSPAAATWKEHSDVEPQMSSQPWQGSAQSHGASQPTRQGRSGRDETGGSKNRLSQQNAQQNVAHWTPQMHKVFIELVHQQVLLGNRPGTSLNKNGWNSVVEEFFRCTGVRYNKRLLKNHWNQTRESWKIWHQLVDKTGVGWDPVTGTVLASEEEWSDYLQSYPEAKNLRIQGLQYGNELDTIFSGATGQECIEGDSDVVTESQDQSLVGSEVDLNLEDVENNHSSQRVRARSKGPRIPSSSRPKKFSGAARLGRELNRSCTDAESRSSTPMSGREDGGTTIKDCIQVLNMIEGVSKGSELYMFAVDMFLTKEYREAFIALGEPELQLAWLNRQHMMALYSLG